MLCCNYHHKAESDVFDSNIFMAVCSRITKKLRMNFRDIFGD